MPARTNTFQDVVAIIYEHLAGEASKTESAMLANRLTGEPREVDVVLRAMTAGHETVIAIEAAARSRKASSDWVEQMIGKHKNLPTDKVVLVAEAGFYRPARKLALAEGMVPLTPESLTGPDPAGTIVSLLPSLWPKTVNMTPEGAGVTVTRPDGSAAWFRAPADLDLVLGDETLAFDLRAFYRDSFHANFRAVADQIGLGLISEDQDCFFTLQIGPPVTIGIDDEPHQLFARWVDENDGHVELHRIEKVVVHGRAIIHVAEIPLTHRRLGEIDVRYAFGTGKLGDKEALVVATKSEHGEKLTIRMRDSGDVEASKANEGLDAGPIEPGSVGAD